MATFEHLLPPPLILLPLFLLLHPLGRRMCGRTSVQVNFLFLELKPNTHYHH